MFYWFSKVSSKKNTDELLTNIVFFYKNFFSWYSKFVMWQFYFLGFYFDEIFSKIIKTLYLKVLLLPGFFFFEKWFAYWIGIGFFKNFLKIFNNFFFFERLDFFFFFISILNLFAYLLIYLLIIFFLFI